jgi:hypothetical protein
VRADDVTNTNVIASANPILKPGHLATKNGFPDWNIAAYPSLSFDSLSALGLRGYRRIHHQTWERDFKEILTSSDDFDRELPHLFRTRHWETQTLRRRKTTTERPTVVGHKDGTSRNCADCWTDQRGLH